jgi:dipeptidyl aminopeptidase/acylaminoacyl peptidase
MVFLNVTISKSGYLFIKINSNMKIFIITSMLFLILSGCTKKNEDYLFEWNNFETHLIHEEKSFQSFEPFSEQMGDFKSVVYDSEGMKLKALLNTKNIEAQKKKPVIVYLHGGFALSIGELENTKRFTEEGYIVFAPSYRGENDNPGYFEVFMGEVNDAKAAIKWIASQEFVDRDRIYVFGWSVGGGISLSLSLHNDIPINLSGSSAGIYDRDLIKAWATEDDYIIFPYDYKSIEENYFRLPLYNLDKMTRTHFTYIGIDDDFKYYHKMVDSLYAKKVIKLRMKELLGDHVSSLPKAMRKFMNEVRKYEKQKNKSDM